MGGIVGLTIRFSPEHEYRGSCWTNVLPDGLWAADFYIDADTSKRHAQTWLDQLLAHRRANPTIEELWGGHNMLAPVEYGIVLVDYVTSTLLSAQGYSAPDWLIRFESEGFEERRDKWDALQRAGLLTEPGPWPEERWRSAWVKLPFKDVRCGDIDAIPAALTWVSENFTLSAEEKAAWEKFIKHSE